MVRLAKRSITRTREVGPLALRAEVAPATLDMDRRTVDLVWTTGARVLRGFFESYYEELSLDPKHVRMGRLQNGAPLLDSHNGNGLGDVLGVVESARLETGRGTATVRFDRGPQGEDALRKVADGIVRNVSVGYRTYRMTKVEDGEDRTPVYRAVDWEPYELSMVPIGADAGAGVRSEAATKNPCEFIEEKIMGDETETTKASTATRNPPERPVDNDQVRAAEQERILGIQRIGRALKRPGAEIDDAVRKGTLLADYRAHAQDQYAEQETIRIDRQPRVEAGEDARQKWLRGAQAWLFQRAAVDGLVAADLAKRGQPSAVDPGEFRGMRLVDLARQSLERDGVRTAGMLPMDLIGLALTHRSPTAGLASTGDFPVLLENTLHKVLLASYGTTPDTWSQFCAVGSVSDFRPHKRYRLGSFSQLQPLNENGEFANKPIPDAVKESITAGTKGNIIGISRQALINDDLGAFSRVATALGRAARLSIEIDVYALLGANGGLGPAMSDGNPLFHASHNNLGPGAALSADAIDQDRIVMAQQKDPAGNEILDLRPAILVVPIGLGGKARQINNGQYDFDASNKFQIPNKVLGLFQTIVDTPRLAGTRRYLFASPAIAPTIEVAFLDGQQQPFMDIMQGWRIDGVEWKVRLDYAVGAVDFRAAVTNPGA